MKQSIEPKVQIRTPDVSIENLGSLFAFMLHTRLAQDWVRLHADVADWLWQGNDRFLCESGYAFDLASGMVTDGLKIE